MNIFQRRLSIVFSFFVFFFNNAVLAQSQKEKELQSLFDSLPEVKEVSISVHTLSLKNKIADVVLINDKVIVAPSSFEGWSKIRFQRKVVPVWVSEQYIEQTNNVAKVTANSLYARSAPSLSSEKVGAFEFGYVEKIQAKRNGFVKLNAPVDIYFMARDSDINQLSAGQVSYEGSAPSNFYPVVENNKPKPTPQSSILNQKRLISTQVNESVPVSKRDTSQSHVIAPGDSISLLVFGESELSRENVRVPENGNVSLPLIGEVRVVGKTTKEVEREIQSILASGYVKNPRLSVSIFSYRPIFIRGAVESTGAFPYSEGLTIAKSLALAGGVLSSAKKNGVSVLRDGNVIETELSLDSQYQISSGDVVTIDEEQGVRESENLFIYLHGEVSNPGEYRYRKDLTVEKAIALSGGFTARASRKKINITRYTDVDENQKPTTLKKVKLYTTIMPGDVINVRASLF